MKKGLPFNRGRQHQDVEAEAGAGTRTNMSTEQPFDTDQPLFPGTEGVVDELIKQVNVMEGYGNGLSAPGAPTLSPENDGTLRRKSRMNVMASNNDD